MVPYDSALLEAERNRIEAARDGWVHGGIEHAGSTAAPGLAAKPVIEIMVGVENLKEAGGALTSLAELGFLHAPNKSDIMHWFCKPSVAVRTHHLCLIEKDSPSGKLAPPSVTTSGTTQRRLTPTNNSNGSSQSVSPTIERPTPQQKPGS
jgi:GrpB-like predicted nucleotidyltransferase (UPF0157 family)